MMKMKIRLLFGVTFIALLLTGCTDPFAEYRTDREYYQTHTGTTAESQFDKIVQDEKLTDEKEGETIDKNAPIADGDITKCDLRTGMETKGYQDAMRTSESETIPANEVLAISEETEGSFRVSYKGNDIWVDSTKCMINAKQFIPSLQVDMVFGKNFNDINMGDTKIPGLTDRQFYNRNGIQDGEEVWVRYEVAVKLLEAQKLFWEDGYCIKIYDAYRPGSVTTVMWDKYTEFLKGGVGSELKKNYFKNGYWENSFLDSDTSPHNYGIAVDLSIVEKDTGRDILMPSAIYSLDYRSGKETWFGTGTTEDNNAQYLESTMQSKGFATSKSEWWHFQDNTLSTVMFEVSN